jgi:hypothetical protein
MRRDDLETVGFQVALDCVAHRACNARAADKDLPDKVANIDFRVFRQVMVAGQDDYETLGCDGDIL